jgi:hypothetical protein
MHIVDARSGQTVRVGDVVDYGQREWWRLLQVKDHLLTADMLVEGPQIAPSPPGSPAAEGQRVFRGPDGFYRAWVRAPIRYFDPRFSSWRTAIVPT